MGEGVPRPQLSLQKVRYLKRFEVWISLPEASRSDQLGALPISGRPSSAWKRLSSLPFRWQQRAGAPLGCRGSPPRHLPTSTVRRSAARPTHGPASARFAALRSDDLIGCDAVLAAASATLDTPAAFLIGSMMTDPAPVSFLVCELSHGPPSFSPAQTRQRLASWQGDDHAAGAYRQVHHGDDLARAARGLRCCRWLRAK